MNIVAPIQKFFVVIFLYIFRLTSFAVRRLYFTGKGVALEDKASDFFDIFKTTRVFFIFNLLALFVFTLLPQGKDIILIVIEDLSGFRVWSLISLFGGLFGWCIISEFGARYKIYITDNSGLSLTDERVNFRKEAQKFVSSIYLLLPVVIVMMSVIIVSFNNIKKWDIGNIWPFIVVLLLLILVFTLLSKFYLDSFFISELRKKNVWYKVRDVELHWANKLFGIYNDYVFMVRKSSNFKDENTTRNDGAEKDPPPDANIKNTYARYTALIEALPSKQSGQQVNTIEGFPRDYFKEGELAPVDFSDVTFHQMNYVPELNMARDKSKNEPEFIYKENSDGYYRWIYKNNPSFYKTLHLQVFVIAISSLLFMLLISIISPKCYLFYEIIGSPALVCLSFACWLGIYVGVLYIDSRFRKKVKLPIRLILFLWFLIVSFLNDDHPVYKNDSVAFNTGRPYLNKHFDWWLGQHLYDTGCAYKIIHPNYFQPDSATSNHDSLKNKDTIFYPVYFITAEGGALRTGAFTAMLLARLQDAFPDFKNHIYAFSSVSGGSVGVGFFNAVAYLEPNGTAKSSDYYQAITRKFFSQDQLSPVVGKLFYADILNNFWPSPVANFDRAIALEKSWERSYFKAFARPADKNIFSTNFMSCYNSRIADTTIFPAWFINTTEVETGLQCYISNVIADSFILARQRDLLAEKIHYGINYSTAINFSSRFPLFSPSAALYQSANQTYHYVDGGYVENTGSKTMLEIIQSLRYQINKANVKPYIIQLRFSDTDSSTFQNTGFLNEINSIVSGMYNTRTGSSTTYTEQLQREIKNLNGEIIQVPLPASSNDVPMSWVFSRRSFANLNKVIDSIMADTNNDLHQKLPHFINSNSKTMYFKK